MAIGNGLTRREQIVGGQPAPHLGDEVSLSMFGIVFSAQVVEFHADGSWGIQPSGNLKETRWVHVGTSVTVYCPGGQGHE